MVKYLKAHEENIKSILDSGEHNSSWRELSEFNRTQIEFLQHERLIHLIVTMSFGMFLLMGVLIFILGGMLFYIALPALFLLMLIPYIIHYYKLENGVQRLYSLHNEIEKKCNEAGE